MKKYTAYNGEMKNTTPFMPEDKSEMYRTCIIITPLPIKTRYQTGLKGVWQYHTHGPCPYAMSKFIITGMEEQCLVFKRFQMKFSFFGKTPQPVVFKNVSAGHFMSEKKKV